MRVDGGITATVVVTRPTFSQNWEKVSAERTDEGDVLSQADRVDTANIKRADQAEV